MMKIWKLLSGDCGAHLPQRLFSRTQTGTGFGGCGPREKGYSGSSPEGSTDTNPNGNHLWSHHPSLYGSGDLEDCASEPHKTPIS